jgi:amino acid transporter
VVALLALGGAAAVFSFLPLKHVIGAILSIRAVIPFIAQIAGALILRRKLPASARPFRMWLYPVPALIALVLWGFVLFSPEKGFRAAGLLVLAAGTLVFLVRSRLKGEWPWRRIGNVRATSA